MARLRAVVVIQPPGLGGRPSPGHLCRAAANASWTASSAASMSPKARMRDATDLPYSSRKIRLTTVPPTVNPAVPSGCTAAPNIHNGPYYVGPPHHRAHLLRPVKRGEDV